MSINIRGYLKVALLATACLLQGCAIGVVRYTSADIPPKAAISTLKSVPIYMTECREGMGSLWGWIKVKDFSPSDFLTSEYGLTVQQGQPVPGERAIYVQLTPDGYDEPTWGLVSAIVNFLSFSTVPGYRTGTQNYTIQIVFTKTDGRSEEHSFKSQISRHEYLWLPLILKLEYVGSINGIADSSGEKLLDAKKGIAGAIALEIQKQYEAAGGVGGWRTENLDSAAYCSK